MRVQVEGYFGGDRGKSNPGRVLVTVTGSGLNETLTVEYVGKYEVIVPLRQVEQLVAQTRSQVSRERKAAERSISVPGYYSAGPYRLRKGTTMLWFWTDNTFSMLSLEFQNQGQISLPYQPVDSAIRSSRRNLV